MSDLIPSITVTEFRNLIKKMTVPEIRELKSLEVYSDGEHLFTVIIPHGDFMTKDYAKTQAEYLGERANITGGVDPLIEKSDAVPVQM